MLQAFLDGNVDESVWEKFESMGKFKRIFAGYLVFYIAILNEDITLVNTTLRKYPDLKSWSTWYDQDPLCLVSNVEMATFLIEAGASIKRTKYDNALDYAIKSDNLNFVTYLVVKWSQLYADTPVHHRCFRSAANSL